MKLFNVTPYLLLLEQENSNEETLSKANAEFVKEVYELQRAENDITIVLFQLQYLSCRLVILREHYRTAQKEHLICYSYIIGTLTYLEGMQAHCKFAYEIHPAGADVSTVPAGTPPVIWTSEVINLIELLYACHELKLFNGGHAEACGGTRVRTAGTGCEERFELLRTDTQAKGGRAYLLHRPPA